MGRCMRNADASSIKIDAPTDPDSGKHQIEVMSCDLRKTTKELMRDPQNDPRPSLQRQLPGGPNATQRQYGEHAWKDGGELEQAHVTNARAGGGFDPAKSQSISPVGSRPHAPKYRDDFEKDDRDVGEETDVRQ